MYLIETFYKLNNFNFILILMFHLGFVQIVAWMILIISAIPYWDKLEGKLLIVKS